LHISSTVHHAVNCASKPQSLAIITTIFAMLMSLSHWDTFHITGERPSPVTLQVEKKKKFGQNHKIAHLSWIFDLPVGEDILEHVVKGTRTVWRQM